MFDVFDILSYGPSKRAILLDVLILTGLLATFLYRNRSLLYSARITAADGTLSRLQPPAIYTNTLIPIEPVLVLLLSTLRFTHDGLFPLLERSSGGDLACMLQNNHWRDLRIYILPFYVLAMETYADWFFTRNFVKPYFVAQATLPTIEHEKINEKAAAGVQSLDDGTPSHAPDAFAPGTTVPGPLTRIQRLRKALTTARPTVEPTAAAIVFRYQVNAFAKAAIYQLVIINVMETMCDRQVEDLLDTKAGSDAIRLAFIAIIQLAFSTIMMAKAYKFGKKVLMNSRS